MSKKRSSPCAVCDAKLASVPDHTFLIIQTDQPDELVESLSSAYEILKKRYIFAVVLTHDETFYTASDELLSQLGLKRVRPLPCIQ